MEKKFQKCSIDGCDNNSTPGVSGGALGYCAKHYQRLKKHGDPNYTVPRTHRRDRLCSIEGCCKPVSNRDLCSAHYTRLMRHGDPLAGGEPRGFVPEWLLKHVGHDGDDCLIWPFARLWNGHGHFRQDNKDKLAHREMCRLSHGEPPSDIHEAAHSCGKAHEGCVNPNHLRWATPKENHADKVEHGTLLYGEEAPASKLTDDQVRRIRRLAGVVKQQDLADQYGVLQSTISRIQSGENWRRTK